MNPVKMVALTALAALLPLATAQASAPTPQAAMVGFCQDLEQHDLQAALFNMTGLDLLEPSALTAEERPLFRALLQMELELTHLSRCEVLGGTGNKVELHISRPDYLGLQRWLDQPEADAVLEDPELDALFNEWQKLLASESRDPLEGLNFATKSVEVMNLVYTKSALPLDTTTLAVELENEYGRWMLADEDSEALLKALTGKVEGQ